MAVEKRVVLSQLEVLPDGTIGIRLDKQVVEGDAVLAHEYHRTVVAPGVDPDAQLAAVNAHLADMTPPWPPVDDDTTARIRRIVEVEHTSDVVDAHRLAQAEPPPAP